MPAIGMRGAQQRRLGDHAGSTGTIRGSTARGTPNSSSSSSSQASVRDVEQQRPRGVRDVGDVLGAAGQPPDQPAVDRPEREPSRRPSRAGVVEQPAIFVAEKYGSGIEAGALADAASRRPLSAAQASAVRPVLPDDRAMHGPARRAGPTAPSVSRWLVMPIAGESPAPIRGLVQRLDGGLEHALPDLLRIVLDPARLREVLRQLGVAAAEHVEGAVDDQASRPARALIDRQDHERSSIPGGRVSAPAPWQPLGQCTPTSYQNTPNPPDSTPLESGASSPLLSYGAGSGPADAESAGSPASSPGGGESP